MLIECYDREQWHKVLNLCKQFDVYHFPEYALIDPVSEGVPYLFYHQLAAVPFVVDGDKARSVYGYPGFLGYWHLEIYNKLYEELDRLGVVSFETRLHPIINQDMEYPDLEEVGTTVAIDLQGPDQRSKGHKADIKQAHKNGIYAWPVPGHFIKAFAEMYWETMERNEASSVYMFGLDYFMGLATFMPHHTLLWAAQNHKGRIISMALFFKCCDTVQYHLAATSDEFTNAGGAKIILDTVSRWAKDQGFKWLHLGGGLGGNEDDPLFRFKAGFSKHRFPFRIARWYA